MWNKLVQMLVVILVVMGMSLPLALADTAYVSGKVKSVDAEKGSLVVVTEDGETKILSVPKEMLKGVKPGHEVDVKIADGKVKRVDNYSADS